MERRSDLLIQELRGLLGTDEVYFQPSGESGTTQSGESYIFTGMKFPCFVMERTTAYQSRANDKNYLFRPGYRVTYINQDEPDDEMIELVINHFQLCHYQRHFISDGLHHDVFMIYY